MSIILTAIIHLIVSLGSLCRGLVRFDISHTKVTGKGLNKIAETLSHNAVVGSRFQYLNFADNPAKGDDLQVRTGHRDTCIHTP